MPTPIFICLKGSNQIRELDSPLVVKDGANFDGTGGSNQQTDRSGVLAYFRTNPMDIVREEGAIGSVGVLRNVNLNVDQSQGCTLEVFPVIDEKDETPQQITTTLIASDDDQVNHPFHIPGTKFQVDVELTAFADEVRFGKMSAEVIPYRRER